MFLISAGSVNTEVMDAVALRAMSSFFVMRFDLQFLPLPADRHIHYRCLSAMFNP